VPTRPAGVGGPASVEPWQAASTRAAWVWPRALFARRGACRNFASVGSSPWCSASMGSPAGGDALPARPVSLAGLCGRQRGRPARQLSPVAVGGL